MKGLHKRIIALFIAIVISVLPLAAFSDADPIVGIWYFYMDFKVNPELKTQFGEYDSLLCSYAFLENGTIVEIDIMTKDDKVDAINNIAGKWEKDGSDYKYSIIGIGEGKLSVDGDILWLTYEINRLSIPLHKIQVINPYTDLKVG